jgi:deoxyribose-phosphate aldolase
MNLNEYIDHTNLKSSATRFDIEKLCTEAAYWKFASVCVNPIYVPLACGLLKGTDVKVCTVIGFPLGANSVRIKMAEAEEACENGCDEYDMVMNLAALKERRYSFVVNEIAAVKRAIRGGTLKVIIETGLLTEHEKDMAVKLVCEARADFVKTCTGFTEGKATVKDVELLKKNVDLFECTLVKASGGIRTYEEAAALIEAGASRLGTSSGVKIMQQAIDAGAI